MKVKTEEIFLLPIIDSAFLGELCGLCLCDGQEDDCINCIFNELEKYERFKKLINTIEITNGKIESI